MKSLTLGVLFFVLAPSFCFAQAAKTIAVAVKHTGSDSVGEGVAFSLKEAIRRSQSFYLVDDDIKLGPRIVVSIVSVSIESRELTKGDNSAIGYAILYDSLTTPVDGILLTLLVQTCGRDRIETCANILPKIDQEVENLRKNWPALWKTL